jgi:hypothetical protein
MYAHGLIAPVLALVAWTFVMWLWMYAARIPAMQKARIDLQAAEASGAGLDALPRAAQRPAENYNHLHEQPMLFYAVALSAHLLNAADAINIGLAWTYVTIRIVHSLIQATANIIMVRFLVFALGSAALFALFVRTAMAMLAT